jgi:hypothetical protein
MKMDDEFLNPAQDYGGIWPFIMAMSGYVSKMRGSETIEPTDLLKAIYIADLEHVAMLWDDWERFENLVSNQQLFAGQTGVYINRTLEIINLQLSLRGPESQDAAKFFAGAPSKKVKEIVTTARSLASIRGGDIRPFTTRDLLFSICSCDQEMQTVLEQSGLNVNKLERMVNRKPGDVHDK